jgi:hypothetical protein
MTTVLHRLFTTGVSLFILAVLLGQAYASFGPMFGVGTGFRFWPIVSYAMYSRAHYDGETVDVYDLLEGTLSDGTVVEISRDSLGLSFWFYRHLVADLKKDDPVAVQLLIDNFRSGNELVEVRVMSYPIMVTRTGPMEKPSEVLHRITLDGRELARQ